jgi:putative FmdB family regulatory protein
MPIYEFECTQCGHIEEAFQRISEKPLETCSQCSGKLRKLISHSSFHLKGTGWYVTDYAKSAKDSSSPATATKSESKPTEKAASSDSAPKKE